MSNFFVGSGNLGAAPELRTVVVKGENRQVLNLRVFFDLHKKDAEGKWVQDEQASFWKTVSLWDARAERAAKILRKGARVRVEGQLKRQPWTDKNGEERQDEVLEAEEVFLSLSRVESVTWREPRADTEANPAEELPPSLPDDAHA